MKVPIELSVRKHVIIESQSLISQRSSVAESVICRAFTHETEFVSRDRLFLKTKNNYFSSLVRLC